jgi:hypothetical protein
LPVFASNTQNAWLRRIEQLRRGTTISVCTTVGNGALSTGVKRLGKDHGRFRPARGEIIGGQKFARQ